MDRKFYSHGKLLISGEYAVLDGALALAIPTRFGQHMTVRENTTGVLSWTGLDEKNNTWFKDEFRIQDLLKGQLKMAKADSSESSERLWAILRYARELNPDFLASDTGYEVETRLEFNRHWGLGSSSTLISNVAQWAEVDAYKLNRQIFGGSGYDIACALSNEPIYYTIDKGEPKMEKAAFDPSFSDQLFFVYLNQKMDSRKAIEQYRKTDSDKNNFISSISGLSRRIANSGDLESFIEAISAHEDMMSAVLKIPPVKELLFHDFPGAMKSLGAWGGDFILAASDTADKNYFKSRGYTTIIPYSEMVL